METIAKLHLHTEIFFFFYRHSKGERKTEEKA